MWFRFRHVVSCTFNRYLRINRRLPGAGEHSASSSGGNGQPDHQLAETNRVAAARSGRTRKSRGGKTHETRVLGLGRKAPRRKARGIPNLEGAQGHKRGRRVDELASRERHELQLHNATGVVNATQAASFYFEAAFWLYTRLIK